MKRRSHEKIMLILIAVIIFAACESPVVPGGDTDEYYPEDQQQEDTSEETVVAVDDADLIAVWVRQDINRAWEFYEDGIVHFFNWTTDEILGDWEYTADADAGTMTITDPGVTSSDYVYEILTDYPGIQDTTWRYAPIANPTSWVAYRRSDHL
jgi:hypothetical protein